MKTETRTVVLRIPESEFAELITLVPEILDPIGGVKYKAWPRYFLSLMRQDLERRKLLLRAAQRGFTPHEEL